MRQAWGCTTTKPQRSTTGPRHLRLTSWDVELSARFPDSSPPVVAVLALWSFGIALIAASGLASVALFLAQHLRQQRHALRKRLREVYRDAADKSGTSRRDFDPALAFAPPSRRVLSLWQGRHLPLAVDVTNRGDRFHVLCASGVGHGRAIPVAWKVLPGGHKEAWSPHRQALLRRLGKREAATAARPAKEKAVRHAGAGATARRRVHGGSKRGLAVLGADRARGECPLPVRLHPEPWPVAGQPPTQLLESAFSCHQT